MRKQATTISTPAMTTVLDTTIAMGLLIAAPATQVSAHPIAGGGWPSLRPRGA